MGGLDVKEMTAGIMKYVINMEHPSGMVIKAHSGLMIFVSVQSGHLHSVHWIELQTLGSGCGLVE